MFHLDLYRLETPEQILSAGVEDYLAPEGVTVIEWAERVFGGGQRPAGLAGLKNVSIEIAGESERKIIYDDFGA